MYISCHHNTRVFAKVFLDKFYVDYCQVGCYGTARLLGCSKLWLTGDLVAQKLQKVSGLNQTPIHKYLTRLSKQRLQQ